MVMMMKEVDGFDDYECEMLLNWRNFGVDGIKVKISVMMFYG